MFDGKGNRGEGKHNAFDHGSLYKMLTKRYKIEMSASRLAHRIFDGPLPVTKRRLFDVWPRYSLPQNHTYIHIKRVIQIHMWHVDCIRYGVCMIVWLIFDLDARYIYSRVIRLA